MDRPIDERPAAEPAAPGAERLAVDSVPYFVAVAKAKTEWEQTVDAMEDPINLQDGFRVRRGNRALAQVGHLKLQEVPGRNCHEILAHRSTPCVGCPLTGEADSSKPNHGEITTDEGLIFEVSLFPLVGSRDGWVVRHRDVTLLRASMASVREQERLAAVGRLAAGAAHEINNPLSFLVANLSSLGRDLERIDALAKSLERVLHLLADGEDQAALASLARFRGTPHLRALSSLGEDGPDRVAEALEGAQRVAGIVRALRTLATERSGDIGPVDAIDSVERALRRLDEEPLESRTIEWVSREPLPVLGQPQGLDEAYYQILRNAFQFTPKDSPVQISALVRGAMAVVRVEDQGPGIAAPNLDRVLEPFFTTHPPGQGLGLGLTIAYGIVRQHGGQLRVASPGERGTAVELWLPLRSAAAGAGPQGAEGASAPEGALDAGERHGALA